MTEILAVVGCSLALAFYHLGRAVESFARRSSIRLTCGTGHEFYVRADEAEVFLRGHCPWCGGGFDFEEGVARWMK